MPDSPSPSPSDNFTRIIPWATHHPHPRPFSATYPRGENAAQPRILFPVALGYREKHLQDPQDTDEKVLCYQLGVNGHTAGWRCFNVWELVISGTTGDSWPDAANDNPNHPNQGCVQDVVHHP
jgi:hypothetical protein